MIQVVYRDAFDNDTDAEHPDGDRLYIDETGNLLIVNNLEDVVAAYNASYWKGAQKS